jgi:hypothetical protein
MERRSPISKNYSAHACIQGNQSITLDILEYRRPDRSLKFWAQKDDERDAYLARSKVFCLRRGLVGSATAVDPEIATSEASVVEEPGLRAALDCDVLFSAVDRPWPPELL